MTYKPEDAFSRQFVEDEDTALNVMIEMSDEEEVARIYKRLGEIMANNPSNSIKESTQELLREKSKEHNPETTWVVEEVTNGYYIKRNKELKV